MIIRVRVAVLELDGPLVKEADLEVKDGSTLAYVFKRADRALALKNKVFKSCLKGKYKASVLINGDRVDMDAAGSMVLHPEDEVSLLSGMAGG